MMIEIQNIMMSSVVVFCVLVNLSLGAAAPSFITACKLGENECIKGSFQNAIPGFVSGMPDLSIEVLDPMHLDTIEYELSGLKFKLEDGRLKGWKNTVVDKVDWNADKKTIDLELHSAFVLRGTYTAGGQLLVLPITGHGDMKLKTKDMRFKMHLAYEVVKGEDGKDHMRFKNKKITWQETVGAHYTLTNLFGGNKELGEAMHHFLNENWKVVTNDLGGPIIDSVLKKMYGNVQTFLSKVPLEELILQ